ncbi:MAG: ATP-binding cassette domain-containing protein [Candidatus Absconditabacterales bacterium]
MEHTDKDILIRVEDLTRGYPENPTKVFDRFHFALTSNEFRVLMGRSGTGKTTLARLIIGQITPPHKTIFYRDEDISKFTEIDQENYRRKIGIVFQDYKLLEELSVKENVSYPLKVLGLGETIISSKLDTIIQKLGLRDIINTPVKFLSAGEKQKICLARAMIHDPEFLIADEPTGNLDWEHTQQVADLLMEVHKMGNTVLLITHDIHLVHYLKEKYQITLDVLK